MVLVNTIPTQHVVTAEVASGISSPGLSSLIHVISSAFASWSNSLQV
jgi:hypothetical protein